MSTVNFPQVDVTLIGQPVEVSVAPKRTMFIGQKLVAGSATAGVVTSNVGINQENALFGVGSMLADMISSFRGLNEVSRIDAIALDDVAGTDATGTIVITGNATKAGTITIWVGNIKKVVTVAVAIGDTPTVIGDAIETAIIALTSSLVVPVNVTGTVTLTAKNSGTVANDIGIMVDLGEVLGSTIALTAMASGATDPSMAGLPALITEKSDIVMPFTYGIVTFKDLLDTRFNTNNKILDGRLITAINDTQSNLSTVGDAENSQSLVIIGGAVISKALKKGADIFAMPYERSAEFAGVRTLRLEKNVNISDFMTTRNPLDQKGGVHTSSVPYANTGLNLPIVPEGEGFTDAEVVLLKASGISVLGNNQASNQIIAGEILTTYKTNTAGQVDITYKFLNSVDTSTGAREFIFNSLKADYAQRRMTLGTPTPNTASIGEVKSDMSKYYLTLTSEAFSLLQGGIVEQGKNEGRTILSIFKDNLTVTFDVANGIINIQSILPIVGQVRSIIVPLSIVFDVNSL